MGSKVNQVNTVSQVNSPSALPSWVRFRQQPLLPPLRENPLLKLQTFTLSAFPPHTPAANKATAPKPVDPANPRAGGPWTPEEEQQLRDAFAAKKSFEQIAADHGRSRGAITTRLVKLGLITINDQPRADRPPPNIPADVRAINHSPSHSSSPSTANTDTQKQPTSADSPQASRSVAPTQRQTLSPINFDPKDCPF